MNFAIFRVTPVWRGSRGGGDGAGRAIWRGTWCGSVFPRAVASRFIREDGSTPDHGPRAASTTSTPARRPTGPPDEDLLGTPPPRGTTGEYMSKARDRVPDRAASPTSRPDGAQKNGSSEASTACSSRWNDAWGRESANDAVEPRPFRANRAESSPREGDAFCNFCRKWYGQAGGPRTHLSACSASLALYTRSARERPVRSSVKLFMVFERGKNGGTKPEPRRLFDLTTLQVAALFPSKRCDSASV